MSKPCRHLAVADMDSRLGWVLAAGRHFAAAGSTGETILVRSATNPSAAQLSDLGLPASLPGMSLDELGDGAFLSGFDVVLLGLMGPDLARLLARLRARWSGPDAPARRPLLVTGSWGITGLNDEEGLLWRTGCDLYCVNSRHDMSRLGGISEDAGLGREWLVPTGVMFAPHPAAKRVVRPIRQVLFAAQPPIPARRSERMHLLGRLVDYAKRHPQREVLIKGRTRPGEPATHFENFPYEELAREFGGGVPENLRFVYGPIGPLIDAGDLVLTVSSAAFLEAAHRGCPAALISDFGVGQRQGNLYFLGSGAFASMDDIVADRLPEISADWLDSHAFHPDFTPANLVSACGRMLDHQAASGRALPMTKPFFDPLRHPAAFAPVAGGAAVSPLTIWHGIRRACRWARRSW